MQADTGPGSFRSYLQEELVRRCKKNPRYSLRAFARVLQVEPSYLSKLLRGERSLTERKIISFSKSLSLNPELVESFVKPTAPARSEPGFVQLSEDRFQVISEWYHFALLELMTVKDFIPSVPWAARALGLRPTEVRAAVERLARLGFIELLPNGTWKSQSGNHTTLNSPFSPAALRKMQTQTLSQAIEALDLVPIDQRDQSTMTMAISTRLLPQAKERIKQFRRDLGRFLQESEPTDEVYHLTISLYPVSKVHVMRKKKGKGRK
jgi:transcriptional regulator with XRE-family HTH domain